MNSGGSGGSAGGAGGSGGGGAGGGSRDAAADAASTMDAAGSSDTGAAADMARDGAGAASDGGASPMMSFFVTSEKSATGNLGGIAMADAKCKRLAEAAGVTGKTWKAYLSTSTENARTRIGQGPWHNFKGQMIAANIMQLHEEGGMKNNLTQQTALTDKGEVVPGRNRPQGTDNEHDILTGSTMAGMAKANATCNNWTSTQGASGVGHGDRMGIQSDPVVAASWNAAHEGQCANTSPGGGAGRFYCFAAD